MREVGLVLNTTKSKATVGINRRDACGECRACRVGRDDKMMTTVAENPIHAKPGQKVVVDMETLGVFELIGFAYGIPLIGFLIGALIGWNTAGLLHIDQALFSFGLAIIFTVVSYLLLHFLDKKQFFQRKYKPVIKELEEDEEPDYLSENSL